MTASAMICGLAGERLGDHERQFLRAAEPAGLILFARNCTAPEQIYRLINEARDAIGRDDTLVLVDQEGQRVQRLAPPTWRALPNACQFGELFERSPDEALDAATRVARLIADDLRQLGFNTDCMPVLDTPVEGAHDIIGPRAFSRDPNVVAALGRAFAEGLSSGGIVAVGKHVPGHGRARADTHTDIAIVEADLDELRALDFAPFRETAADLKAMMTAHVVFPAVDETEPASTSRRMHDDIIRGEIGFDGLLMSDDLSMAALDGTIARRAERVLAAGSDLALHCNGDLAEMEAVAEVVPRLVGPAVERLAQAVAVHERCDLFDREEAAAVCEALAGDVS